MLNEIAYFLEKDAINDIQKDMMVQNYNTTNGSIINPHYFYGKNNTISITNSNPMPYKNFNTNKEVINILFEANSQGYEEPSSNVMDYMLKTMNIIKSYNLSIKSFTPIVEGGIAIDLYYKDKYIQIQFDNEGDSVIYVEQEGNTPSAWDLNFETALSKLPALLN